MQARETVCNGSQTPDGVDAGGSHRRGAYQKVLDARKRPVRGLWTRNGRYYARLAVENLNTGRKEVRRVPLAGVETVAQAQAALRRFFMHREDNSLPMLKRAPKFSDYVEQYLAYYTLVKDAKRSTIMKSERVHLRHWMKHLGDLRLDRITSAAINGFIAKRQALGRSGRTVNLDVIVLRNVLKRAIDDGWIKSLPTANLRPLKWTPRQRELVNEQQIEAVCVAAMTVSKNGQQLTDYVRLLACSGARKSEALRLRWTDVDFKLGQLTIGSDGLAKNHQARVVDFNARLRKDVLDMKSRRAPDSQWIFPSPQRGEQDRTAKTFRETLLLARQEVGMPGFGFHDCRHFFISMCVMSGIDYMTIARWVGHQDGGVLIGKVYGHLSNEHAKRQAQRIQFHRAQ